MNSVNNKVVVTLTETLNIFNHLVWGFSLIRTSRVT